MRKLLFLLGVAAFLSACAKPPEAIAPAYVSEYAYQDFDCRQLTEEEGNVRAALAVASQQQSDARTNDMVGWVFLGLPVSTLSGGNVAYQVADLKGQMTAISRAMVRKHCASVADGGRRSAGTARSYAHQPAVEVARDPGVRPLPTGRNIAQPVNYSAEEVLSYCHAGWETRQLTDGTTEHNPCYYQ